MPESRYFYPQTLQQNSTIDLEDTEFHHLKRVMRAQKGDTLEIINGMGILAQGIVTELNNDSATIEISDIHEEKKKPFSLSLALGISKPSHLEFAVEKIVELGVDTIWLYPAERSERKEISPTQRTRLQNIVISATKQCGRLFLPTLEYVSSFEKIPTQTATALFGHPENNCTELPELKNSVILFIGPESGFSEKEVQNLKSLGIVPYCFHPNILRTETAAIVGCALLYNQLSTK